MSLWGKGRRAEGGGRALGCGEAGRGSGKSPHPPGKVATRAPPLAKLWLRLAAPVCPDTRGGGPGNRDEPPPHSHPQVAAILTLPFDVVKTQRQVALGAVEAVRGAGPWRVWGRAAGQQGLTGLSLGLQ